MYQYTTPSIELLVKGVDISAHHIFATVEQKDASLTRDGDDLTVEVIPTDDGANTKISFELTQTESAKFNFNSWAEVQVNWITAAGKRKATEIKKIPVMKNLLNEVVSYD